MRALWWPFALLALLGGGGALSPVSAQGAGALGGAPSGDPLVREIEVSPSLTDADLATAAKALQQGSRVRVAVEGDVPDRKVTFAAKDLPIRRAASTLAALYGVAWELRGNTIIFSPRRPDTPLDRALRLLHDRGLGGRFHRRFGDGGATAAQVQQELVGLFPADTLQQMLASPKDAVRLGGRVRDLPPDKQQRLLAWQLGVHQQNALACLNSALQPFDEQRYLNCTAYLQFQQGAVRPCALGIEGDGLSMVHGFGASVR